MQWPGEFLSTLVGGDGCGCVAGRGGRGGGPFQPQAEFVGWLVPVAGTPWQGRSSPVATTIVCTIVQPPAIGSL